MKVKVTLVLLSANLLCFLNISPTSLAAYGLEDISTIYASISLFVLDYLIISYQYDKQDYLFTT